MKSSLNLLLLVLTISLAQAAIVNYTQQFVRSSGVFSPLIQAQDIDQSPSQYFLCGLSFRQSQWSTWLNNCNCGKRWYRSRLRYRCNWCANYFWTQANALKSKFCSYSDWNKQIQNVFETGNKISKDWRDISCPKGQYASRISARFGSEHSVDTGFIGLQIKCENPNFSENTLVQDKYGPKPQELSKNKQGLFVSSYQIKYEPNGKLTGVRWNFESMPLVSKIVMTYSQFEALNPTSTIIETFNVSNNAKTTAQQTVSFTKNYSTANKWTTTQSFTSGYIVSESVSVSPLSIVESTSTVSSFSAKTNSFGFNKDIVTTYSSNQKLLVFVPAGKQVSISSVIREQKVNVPYQATLTFVDRFTGEYIGERVVTGIWEGVMTSSVNTIITESELPSNLQKDTIVQDVTNLTPTP